LLEKILIKGARENNLKNVDLELPRGKFIVFTGLSGSGKSSLVFDTIYAEGHRRYVESLSTYARQFLERVDKPDVDYIEGISPAIAFEQKNPVKHSRSTVGTATEIYDYLRLLYAKVGRIICPDCKREVRADTVALAADTLLRKHQEARVYVTFPLPYASLESAELLLNELPPRGFIRVIADGEVYDLSKERPPLREEGLLLVVVDRLVVRKNAATRLADSLETAFQEGKGSALVRCVEGPDLRFSQHYTCPDCDREFERPTPNFFSFNSPYGACQACGGFGNILDYDLDLIIPDKSKSLADGAIAPWNMPKYKGYFQKQLKNLAEAGKVDLNKPFNKLGKRKQELVLQGTKNYIGVYPFFKRLGTKKYKMFIRVFTRKFKSLKDCHQCGGSRLRREALWVEVGGLNIAEVSAMTVTEARDFFSRLSLTRMDREIARDVLREIKSRLDFMYYVGLDYLTLDRLTRTLSGGESQRVNLANQLGARLVGTLYILDEPTIGLHPRDNSRLLDILKKLSRSGNTVMVVEHDREVISSAQHLVDMGPRAGADGGEVVFSGTLSKFLKGSDTLTARYLRGQLSIPLPDRRRAPNGKYLCLYGARENNLKGINVRIPLSTFTCVTGVSGAGKSTLIHDTLYRALSRMFHHSVERTSRFDMITGFEWLRDVVLLDQQPIGKTPRSNPVTYIKAYDLVRKLFAETPGARRQGYTARYFSFNVDGGRCPACKGDGHQKIEMHFMADIFVSCPECQGSRFKQEVLEIKYNGLNIRQVLELTVDQAARFFTGPPRLLEKLQLLQEVGLGYLRLGQPATTLSGGEAQRLKIAAELSGKKPKGVLYILDEPTTGLHFDDVKKLLMVLNRLVDGGNTVLVVEHNLDVIKTADHIIDLGPEGGEQGGYIVAEGSPEYLAQVEASHTGRYLKETLNHS
jgi:excinuclease ABC subunit A